MIGKCYLIFNNNFNKSHEYFKLSLKANNNFLPSIINLIELHISFYKEANKSTNFTQEKHLKEAQ